MRRILGAVILLVALVGVGVGAVGAMYGHLVVDGLGSSLDTSLDLASQSLRTATETLLLTKTTAGQLSEGLDTIGSSALDVPQTISQTQLLVGDIGQIVTHDVPDGMEALQNSVPGLAQAAAMIDEALRTLSDLQLEQMIQGFPMRLDLDLNYAPEVSIAESIELIGSSLEGVPLRLRGLESNLDATKDSLGTIRQDLVTMAGDLSGINSSITDIELQLDEYVRIVGEINTLIGQARVGVSRQLEMVKLGLTVLMAWLGLMQIAPLYIGWELMTGRRSGR